MKILFEAKLVLNLEKCSFIYTKLFYLGHIISSKGIEMNPEVREKTLNFKEPTNLKQLRGFIGLTSYCRKFIPDFAEMCKPLTEATKNKKSKYSKITLDAEAKNAFVTLKERMSQQMILAFPSNNAEYVIQCDASNFCISGCLEQIKDAERRPINFFSRKLNKAELNYTVTEKECLAIVQTVKHYKHYLMGKKFTILTDHMSLKWLMGYKNPTGRLARWIFTLQMFNFEIKHIKGSENVMADALSRLEINSIIVKELDRKQK